MDRASGSGVFARDPDALLDLIELEIDEQRKEQELNRNVCSGIMEWLQSKKSKILDEISQDDALNQRVLLDKCQKMLDKVTLRELSNEMDKIKKKCESKTAWRIEGTLREFPKFSPLNMWFDYPIHRIDATGMLQDIDLNVATQQLVWQKKKKSPEERKKEKMNSLNTAFDAANMSGSGTVKLSDISDFLGVSINTAKKYVDESKEFKRENGLVSRCQISKK